MWTCIEYRHNAALAAGAQCDVECFSQCVGLLQSYCTAEYFCNLCVYIVYVRNTELHFWSLIDHVHCLKNVPPLTCYILTHTIWLRLPTLSVTFLSKNIIIRSRVSKLQQAKGGTFLRHSVVELLHCMMMKQLVCLKLVMTRMPVV